MHGHLIDNSLSPAYLPAEQQLDWFSRFSTADIIFSLYVTLRFPVTPPKKIPFRGGSIITIIIIPPKTGTYINVNGGRVGLQ